MRVCWFEMVFRCGVLTFEIEHVDAATLEKLEKQGVDCQPKASTVRIIQVLYWWSFFGFLLAELAEKMNNLMFVYVAFIVKSICTVHRLSSFNIFLR
jgi:hypothetical protein